ncbi:MAG: L-alanine-DL-glutamate epimerase-like enolase superfamily enzyme [Parvicella sp.]|jgi:L-alanine-DL-glutamate epimerase-like enolase superfamily enzyme
MKIAQLNTQLIELPLDKPIGTAIHSIHSVGCVLVSLVSDEGLVGEGYLFTINAVRLKAFDETVRSFAPLVEGQDAEFIEAIWQNIWQSCNPIGQKGMTIGALSAIDTALWDLHGKALNKPLHRLFGACRSRIKTYASGGLWLSQSIDELTAEAQLFIAQGFKSMKLRLGSLDWRDDVQRAAKLREAVGPEIEILSDANQSLNAKQAIRLGRALEALDIGWLEEPTPAHDLVGHAEVRAKLDMPIASGETEYTRFGMRDMINAKACDILMPDLQRMGGLTEFRKVAALAASYDMPISSHIFTEHSLSIAGSAPNCISVEHMPWFAELFNEEMELIDGELVIPERPGCGFTFNPAAISKYRLSS